MISIPELAACFCGVSLVIGGLILIYQGKIKISGTDKGIVKSKGLEIELRATGIGLFLVGLLFILSALIFGNKVLINFVPNLPEIDGPATISIGASGSSNTSVESVEPQEIRQGIIIHNKTKPAKPLKEPGQSSPQFE